MFETLKQCDCSDGGKSTAKIYHHPNCTYRYLMLLNSDRVDSGIYVPLANPPLITMAEFDNVQKQKKMLMDRVDETTTAV